MASSLSGALGLDKTKSGFSEQSNSSTTQTQEQTSTTRDTGSVTETSQQFSDEALSELDNLVRSLMEGSFSNQAIEGSSKELARFMADRAKVGGADSEQQNAAIVDEARRKGEQDLSKIQQDLARQSGGSTANTLVAGATGEASASLESQLADLQARLGMETRNQQTSELNQAFSSLSTVEQAESQNLSSLLNSLKGGRTTSIQERDLTSETELSSLLNSITDSTKSGTGISRTRSIDIGAGAGNPPAGG